MFHWIRWYLIARSFRANMEGAMCQSRRQGERSRDSIRPISDAGRRSACLRRRRGAECALDDVPVLGSAQSWRQRLDVAAGTVGAARCACCSVWMEFTRRTGTRNGMNRR